MLAARPRTCAPVTLTGRGRPNLRRLVRFLRLLHLRCCGCRSPLRPPAAVRHGVFGEVQRTPMPARVRLEDAFQDHHQRRLNAPPTHTGSSFGPGSSKYNLSRQTGADSVPTKSPVMQPRGQMRSKDTARASAAPPSLDVVSTGCFLSAIETSEIFGASSVVKHTHSAKRETPHQAPVALACFSWSRLAGLQTNTTVRVVCGQSLAWANAPEMHFALPLFSAAVVADTSPAGL